MSNRNTILYLIVGILLVVATHLYISFGGGVKLAPRETVLDWPMLEADTLVVERERSAPVELRRIDGTWRITRPYAAEASQARVSRILDSLVLRKIVETYTDKYLLKAGKRRSDFGLTDPSVKIRVAKGAESVGIMLGDRIPGGDGVFAVVEGDAMTYVLDISVLESADVPDDGFRSRELVTCDAGEIEMFSIKRPGTPMMNFVRKDGRWMLRADRSDSPDSPASNAAIEEFLSALVKAGVKSFVWPVGASNEPPAVTAPLLAGYGLDPESGITVTVYDRTLAPVRTVLGKEAENGLVYALARNSSTVATVDGRLKDLAVKSDFSDLRLFPFYESAVSRIAITDGVADYLLAKKENGDWVMDSPILARADAAEVSRLLAKLLTATIADRDDGGISVSLSTNMPAVKVSSSVLSSEFSFAALRSREITRFDPSDIKRIVSSDDGAPVVSSVVYDRDKRAWIVENSETGTSVRQDAVADILKVLGSLDAVSVVSLKATEAQLKEFGLEKPSYTVSVDFFKENSLRRNIFIGERTETGYYATMGAAFDAVFILSDKDVARITSPLVTK